MSTFQANLLLGPGGADTVPHDLTAVILGSQPSPREFRSSRVLHDHNSVVQRGLLHVDEEDTLPAVCKFVYGDDVPRLRHEAELYEDPHHLKSLQGAHVSRFYGYYEGNVISQGTEVSLGCMILEDCGRMVTVDEWAVYKIKCKIVKALLHIHHLGNLKHDDLHFSFRHVLINKTDDSIRIIDFDHAVAHECEHNGPIDMGAYQPERRDFNCEELYEFFACLGVWTPCDIRFIGRPIYIFRVPTVRRLMKLVDYYYPNADNSYLRPKAQAVLDDYYDAYQHRFPLIGHPLQHKMPLNLPDLPDSDEEPDDEKMPPFNPEVGWRIVEF